MPQTMFAVDQTRQWSTVVFLNSTPKVEFGDTDGRQAKAADGRPKWAVECNGKNRRTGKHEIINLTITADKDPGDGIDEYTPVTLVELYAGVIPAGTRAGRDGRDQVTGGTGYYIADAIRSNFSAPSAPSRKAE